MPFKLDDDPINNLGDTLVNEIPEPQAHAIDQARVDAAREAENISGDTPSSLELDALGIPWDPTQHATGKDGKGVRTDKGAWRKRRGVTGSASYLGKGSKTQTKTPDPAEVEALNKQTLEKQNRMAGMMAAAMLINVSTAIGGDEFQARRIKIPGTDATYDEREFLSQAFGDYFVAKQITDLPPGMVLVSALSMYYLPRFREPKVRERGGKIGAWFKDKAQWIYFKIKYRGKKPPDKVTPKSGKTFDNARKDETQAADSDVS